MKKFLFAALIIMFVVVLAGCSGSKKNGENTTQPEATTAAGTTAAGQVTTDNTGTTAPDTQEPEPLPYTYTIVTKATILDAATQSDKVLKYPEFGGFADVERQQWLNESIVQTCEYYFRRVALPNLNALLDQGAYIAYLTEAAAVTCLTRDFVSMMFRGTVRVEISENSGNWEFFFTLNLDLAAMRELSPEEIVPDLDSLKDKFLRGDFRQVGGSIENIAEQTPLSDLMMPYGQDRDYPWFYFTESDFCMSLEVAGAPGWQSQCVQFGLPLSEAAPYFSGANAPINALVSAANR